MYYVRSNGNFGGKIFAVPLAKRSHAYLTRVRVTRVRARSRMEGVMSESFTLQSMIRGYHVYKEV